MSVGELNRSFAGPQPAEFGHQLSWTDTDWPTASDWVLPFDLALPKVTCCRKLTLVSLVASDKFTSDLDVRG